jgi:tRNA-specific 2-thiouridylase
MGQRQGLGIGGLPGRPEAPWFVLDKDTTSNVLFVTQDTAALAGRWLSVGDVNWLVPPPALPLAAAAKIRYRQTDQPCTIDFRADGRLRVHFARAQRAITPGQYACFYLGDVCLGGGVIESREPPRPVAASPTALAA